MALKCLKKAQALDPLNPAVFKTVTDFYTRLGQETELPPVVKSTIDSDSLLGKKSLDNFIKEWTDRAESAEALCVAYSVLAARGESADSFLAKINDQTLGFTHEVLYEIQEID